jgi:threonine dehydratase
MSAAIPLEEIRSARRRVMPYLHRTPLVSSRALSERLGTEVALKLELLQKTGSFKPRGAFNEILSLDPDARRIGVAGVSGGNFAQGLAFAGRTLDVPTTIVMPASTPSNYVEATQGYGATLELVDDITLAFRRVEELTELGLTPLHPFDDPHMMAGNGTVGLEIVEDAPDLTDLFVSIGGGGLISGVASAVKALRPEVRVWGVETAGADAMRRALDAGRIVEMEITSIAKTLGAPWVSERTLAAARALLEDVVVVSDAEAFSSILLLMERAKVMAEPAASCTVAAAERVRDRLGGRAVLLLCGGNLSFTDLMDWQQRFAPERR